jgi:FMN phosphatase YigB (HAD superfamily)
MDRLRAAFRPVLLTNTGRQQVERTLAAIGIRDCFHRLYTISDSGIIKPSVELLRKLLGVLDAAPEQCLCIGPREDVDVRPAEALGIAARVVRSRDELIAFAGS